MKERPILFSAPMVRAILDGTKTQTRRVVKPDIVESIEFLGGHADGVTPATADDVTLEYGEWHDDSDKKRGPDWLLKSAEYPEEGCIAVGQLYGAIGDHLWVRESFQALFADGIEDRSQTNYKTGEGYKVYYMATDERQEFIDAEDDTKDTITPSIFMPRWASRITLEIVSVRVERLQGISEADCIAEGIKRTPVGNLIAFEVPGTKIEKLHPRVAYQALWESINGEGSWDENPWVWVIEFKRVTQ